MSDQPRIDAFKALAHPVRFAILETLVGRERNVGEIEEASGIGQPALSQQLAVLRTAGLVETRKQAKLVYYSIARENLSALSDVIDSLVGPDPAAPNGTRAPGAANFARLT